MGLRGFCLTCVRVPPPCNTSTSIGCVNFSVKSTAPWNEMTRDRECRKTGLGHSCLCAMASKTRELFLQTRVRPPGRSLVDLIGPSSLTGPSSLPPYMHVNMSYMHVTCSRQYPCHQARMTLMTSASASGAAGAGAAKPKKVLIVGGVAGGASCAARMRRLDEQVEITVFERGPYVSFANCGLPYHVSDVIAVSCPLSLSSGLLYVSCLVID